MVGSVGVAILGTAVRRGNALEYAGVREADGRRVVVTLLPRSLGRSRLARVQYSSEVQRRLSHSSLPHVIGTQETDDGLVIISERCPGERLGRGTAHDIESVLCIAQAVASGLAAFHDVGGVHAAVRPENIVFDPASRAVHLVDAYIGTAELWDWEPRIGDQALLETLSYVAPERTGRTGVTADHRGDLYSLGASLYTLLTGRPPFVAGDALRLIHAHLAELPTAARDLRPELPASLSRIIDKLLAKSPDDRYQSARGLLHDLERCERELALAGRSDFTPGERDWSGKLRFPHRLYGRQQDLAVLTAAFEGVAEHSRTALHRIVGPPGIGKSALVNELRSSVLARRGYFISGKFDQYGGDVPYLAIGQAFEQLARLLLMDSQSRLDAHASRFTERMGGLGSVVTQLAPELELVFGRPPPLPPLPPTEAHARFKLAMERFATVMARAEHPLVLFFDDLQWADVASLEALQAFVASPHPLSLLLIVSYRDGEVGTAHAAGLTLDALRRRGIPDVCQRLEPLGLEGVREWLAACLQAPAAGVDPLARIVHAQTLGNPFFARSFVAALCDAGALACSPNHGWQWDEKKVAACTASADVLAFLARRCGQLPEATRRVLVDAALVDAAFGLTMLAELRGLPLSALIEALEPAVAAGLVLIHRDRVIFCHDKIQEVACAQIPEENRACRHAELARLLLRALDTDSRDRHAFELVRHLMVAEPLLDSAERIEMARIALVVCRQAKSSATYVHGVEVAEAALRALPRAAPRSMRGELRRELAELAVLAGDFARSERAATELLADAASPLEQALAYGSFIVQFNLSARYDDAIACARQGLQVLGISLPESSDDQRLAAERARTAELLGDRPIAALLDSPAMTRADKRIAVEILGLASPALFLRRPDLLALSIEMMTNLSLEYGNVPYSCYAYSFHGFLLAASERYAAGHAFGELGIRLARRLGNPVQECRTTQLTSFFLHYVRPYRDADELNRRGFQQGLESGELEFAGYHAHIQSARCYLDGGHLGTHLPEIVRLAEFAERAKHTVARDTIAGVRMVFGAVTRAQRPLVFQLQGRGDAEYLRDWTQSGSLFAVFVYRVLKAHALYVWEQPEEALEELIAARALASYAPNHVCQPLLAFVGSLCRIARHPKVGVSTRAADRQVIRQNQATLSACAESCPDNYLSKYLLVEAELVRAEQGMWAAGHLYDAARTAARRAGLVQDEALAGELAARGWLSAGKPGFARDYLRDAQSCYARWGADRGLRELQRLVSPFELRSETSEGGGALVDLGGALDAATLMKCAIAISSSISVQDVVDQTLRAALENAGGRRAVLVLRRAAQHHVIAACSAQQGMEHFTPPVPLAEAGRLLPCSLVQFVLRTGSSRVIGDIRPDANFGHDPYVASAAPRSVVCIPSLVRGETLAVLYLENDLVAGAFVQQRVELLRLITAQATVSLQNALLYEALRDREGFIRSLVENSPAHILVLDAEQRITFVNRGLAGLSPGDLLGRVHHQLVSPATADAARDAVERALATGEQCSYECALPGARGEARWYHVRVAPIPKAGHVERVVLMADDTTEARQAAAERSLLEAQLHQAQKLEALGQLAGGVAHDFNNLIAVIMGSASLIRLSLNEALHALDSVADDLNQIDLACERAASLTHRLLTFCRKDVVSPRVFDPGRCALDLEKMLARLLPESVQLCVRVAPGTSPIEADPNQFEQIIMNLAVNARDAMPEGGLLTIQMANVEIDAARASRTRGLAPGHYVHLCVSDTGVGMSPEVQAQAFEPFFTTKPAGSGTGLGLAMVQGAVQRARGHVKLASEPQKGTTFDILFPRAQGATAPAAAPPGQVPGRASQAGSVLICEDEASLRTLLVRTLESRGFRVLAAGDGEEALQLVGALPEAPDLLITDVVMPRMSGPVLARSLRSRTENLPILYISGYVSDTLAPEDLESNSSLLQKPFTPEALLDRVQSLLTRPSADLAG